MTAKEYDMKVTKKTIRRIPVFALVFVLGLTASLVLSGCELDPGSGPNGGGGNGALGATLNLSGQVYTKVTDDNNVEYNYVRFTGNRQVFSDMGHGGSGSITNGQLSFSIGTPSNLLPSDSVSSGFFEGINNIRISPTSTQFAILFLMTSFRTYLNRENAVFSRTENVTVVTSEYVLYVYVDRDANFRADETSNWSSGAEIFRAFNLNLKTGWNALIVNGIADYHPSGNMYSVSTLSVDNPGNHLMWAFFDD